MANFRTNQRFLPLQNPVMLLLAMFLVFTQNIRSQNITEVEYFFNTDPGYGAGNIIPVNSPSPVIEIFNYSISISELSDGFHKLYVRTKDDNGGWSFSNSRSFFKNTILLGFNNLTKLEYFLDIDPGPGNGTDVPITTGPSIYDLEFSVDISGLDEGFHQLCVRTMDQNGMWSLTNRRQFIKEVVNISNPLVTAAEYFFDTDPGAGQGTVIPVATAGNEVILDLNIDITSLPEGFRNLYVRARDNEGFWSLCSRRSFVINEIIVNNPMITSIEYFIDVDPGFGLGEPVSFTPSGNVAVIDHVIDIDAITAGFHKLYVRSKDNNGRWSLSNIRPFYKTAELPQASDIVFAEYFFNTDPGFGNGTIIPVPNPSTHVQDLAFEVDPTGLQTGNHMFFVRTRDEARHWSLTLMDEYCSAPLADFSAEDVWLGNETTFTNLSLYTDENTVYQWDVNGDNITDYTFDHGFTHTYPAQGTYNAKLVLTTVEGCTDEVTKPVSVFTCSPPIWLYVSDTTWNSALLHWTAANMETAWNLEYGLSGFTQGNGIQISNIESDSTLLGNLMPLTSYDFYVQSACYPGTNSSWAGPVSFTTLVEICNDPQNPLAVNVSSDEATLIWESPGLATTWNIEYGSEGFVPGSGTMISGVTDTIYILAGLIPETAYDYYVQSVCSPSTSSSWVGPVTFSTTMQICNTPLNLVAVNISSDEATLMWESPGPEISWNIEYGLHEFVPGNGTLIQNVIDTVFVLTELDPETSYDFYVQSVCSPVLSSSWAGPATFNTNVQSQQTRLWGMTTNGGENDAGVLYFYDPSTHSSTKILDFNGTNGRYPFGSLMKASNGKVYGMTSQGGANNHGVLFEFDPVMQTYSVKLDFNGTDGRNPQGSPIQASNGKIYGMTQFGGIHGFGVLFEYDLTAQTFTKLQDFDGMNGSTPLGGSLIQAPNGKLYGMTYSGGQDGNGVLFEYDPVMNVLIKKIDFTYDNGAHPYGSLIQASNGKFYGMTPNGGAYHCGVLFEYDPATNILIKKIDFNYFENGAYPYGDLIIAGDGKLYGLAYAGGSFYSGTLFEYDPASNNLMKKFEFDGSNFGSHPQGSLVQALNGNLYGVTFEGGINGTGVLFEFDPVMNVLYKKVDFTGSNGSYPRYSQLLSIEGESVCNPPLALIATNISSDEATLMWESPGPATTWNIEYGLQGFIPGSGTNISGVADIIYNLTGLSPETTYDFYVQSVCSPESTSSWAGPVNFSTIAESSVCLEFDGTNDIVEVGDVLDNVIGGNGKQFTIEALIKGSFEDENVIFGKNSDGQTQYYLSVEDQRLTFWWYYKNYYSRAVRGNSLLNDTSNFYHIAFVYDGTINTGNGTERVTMYIDGEPEVVELYQFSGQLTIIDDQGTSPLRIGGTGVGTLVSNPFNGIIKDVKVWSELRTQQQIQTYMNDPVPDPISETTLEAYFQLNEGEGQLVYDLSSSGLTGTLGLNDGIEAMDPIWTNCTLNPGGPCSNPTDGGTIASSQTICFGTYPDTLNSLTPASGYTGTLEYKWQLSTDNVNYTDIAGAVTEDYIPSALTITTWFRRLAKVTCEPAWTGTAVSDTVEITVGNRDQYRTIASGDWSNPAIWEKYNNGVWTTSDHYPTADLITCPNPIATIQPGDTITVSSGISFGNIIVHENAILEIEADADLGIISGDTLTVYGMIITHSTAIVSGGGHFVLSTGAEIFIGSAEGISVSTATGNIQVTGSRWYASGANYVYIGISNQFTGDGLMQNTASNLTINTPGLIVTLSQALSVSGSIFIMNGTLDVNNFDITLGGNWTNSGIFLPGTATVYFNCTVNTYISVSNFYNVVFAGSDTITASGSLTVLGDLTINNYFNAGSFTHYVYGNWINNGVFVYGTSTIQFMGTATYYINISNFYNIIFAGTGTYTATGSLSIYGNVTINNYFDAGAFTHYVYGNWINNGTFVQGTSTIQFSGTGNIYIGVSNFYNVVFACTGTVIASGQLTFYGNVTINNYFDAGSFVHYVYGNWINTGTFVYGTSTINFVGTGTVYIGVSTFYNIIFSGTGTYIASGSIAIYGDITITTNFYAGTYTITVYGDWVNNGIFDYGSSTVEFIGNGNITITQNDFYNVIFGGTGIFIATGSLNFYGNVTINSTFDAGSYDHYIYGNWTNNGTFIYGTSTIYFVGTVNIYIGASSFYNVVFGGTGSVFATGSLTIYGDVTINNYFDAGTFVHYVYGNWFNNGTFVYGTSTITFVGTVNLFISTNEFYNVVFAGSGTYTATGSITFYGNVTINNYFNAGSFTHFVYGNWIVNGSFVYGTSTIHFLGSGNIFIGISNFYNIIFAGTGTITATGSLTIWGDVTINNYFDAGSFAHYVYGNWINNGTFVYGTSTIYFSATVNIYINTNEFYHVVFAGTGNYIATGSITFYGDVTINNYFDAGSFTHYVYGNWTVNGVFVYGTSTIHFMGTGISFVNAGNFYHVIFGGTGTYTATGSLTIYGNVNITGNFGGGSFIHYVYGNWTNTGNFVYGTSTIHFLGSTNILIGESDFYHILFASTGTITATGSLSVYGDFTINTYFDAGAYEHYIYGNWYNYGIFVYGTSTIHFVGTGNIFLNPEEFYHVVFGGSGTVTATGTLIFHGNVTINNYFNAGAFVHYVYGNWTNNGTFVYGTSTIHFTGSGNILIGGSNFYHIIFGGTGTIAANGSLYVYGDVTINNYFDAGSYVHYIYGNWYNYGVFVYGTSTIHFSGSGNVYIGDYEFYHLIFGGTGTVVATGSLTIHGDVTINNYFDAGPYIHYVYGNWTNNGTFVYNTSTIRFVGSGSILIGAGNFYHIIFACSGTVAATGTLYIYGDLTILNHFDAATYDHYVYRNWINNGTFVHGTSRIRFVGSQNLLLGTNNFYHVVFARTGTITANGSLTIYGDLTITNHFDAGSYEHYIHGNWINNGIFVYSTSYIHFIGTVQQTIGGSNETGYYRFRVNNPYGILLNRNVTVHYELILTEGIITTGTYVFIVMPSGTINGGSSTAYIHGRLRCGYNAIGSRAFPVGTASSYGPMVFNYVTLTGTSMVDVEYIGGTIPGTIPANITSYADHYWVISQTGGLNFTFTLTLNVTGFNPLGSVWMMRGDGFNISTVSTTAPNYTNFTEFDAFGDFTLGEVFCANPSGLINRYITYTDAILDWEPGDTETEWNVEYGPAGFTPGTGTMLSNVSTKPLTISGLTPESYYEFYVQSKCSPVVQSSWAGPEPFSTFPKQLDAKIFLEGPYDENSEVMETNLRNFGLIPLSQPYQDSPWNYSGDEEVTTIPPGVVDWILLEWRDASAPSLANNSTYIWRKAALLKADGSIVDMDGSNLPWIGNPQLSGNLYIIVYHRNHLSVISNYGAVLLDNLYEYDFSDQLNKAYGGTTGYKQIGSSPLRFGMVSGDGEANGSVSLTQDINGVWNTDAGKKGYLPGDYDLNGQVQNQDKNDTWKPNLGKTSSVP